MENKTMDWIACYYLFFLGFGLWSSVKSGRQPEATALIFGLELPACGRVFGVW